MFIENLPEDITKNSEKKTILDLRLELYSSDMGFLFGMMVLHGLITTPIFSVMFYLIHGNILEEHMSFFKIYSYFLAMLIACIFLSVLKSILFFKNGVNNE